MKREGLFQRVRFVPNPWGLIGVLTVTVLACLFVSRARLRVQASPRGPQQVQIQGRGFRFGEGPASPLDDEGRKLVLEHIWTNDTPETGSCPTAGCEVIMPAFPTEPSKPCPGLAGTKCDYQIHIVEDYFVSGGDGYFLKVQVDGMDPSPTLTGGIFPLVSGDSDSATELKNGSVDVIITVTNTTLNQLHTISIGNGCVDFVGADGCDFFTGLALAKIAVLKP